MLPAHHHHTIMPMPPQVFIVTNQDSYADYVTWARDPSLSMGGFPLQNIINTGASSSSSSSSMTTSTTPLQAIAAAIREASLQDANLVVAPLDQYLGPEFSLQKVVEHAIIRGKDTVTFWQPPPGRSMSGYAQLAFDTQVRGCVVVCAHCGWIMCWGEGRRGREWKVLETWLLKCGMS